MSLSTTLGSVRFTLSMSLAASTICCTRRRANRTRKTERLHVDCPLPMNEIARTHNSCSTSAICAPLRSCSQPCPFRHSVHQNHGDSIYIRGQRWWDHVPCFLPRGLLQVWNMCRPQNWVVQATSRGRQPLAHACARIQRSPSQAQLLAVHASSHP